MAKNKTFETENSVEAYIASIADEKRRNDCRQIISLMTKKTGMEPKMWGAAIVGFGSYHYKYESGHEGTAPLLGMSSRTNAITLYLSSSFEGRDVLLAKLGKHKTSKACIYIKKNEDINMEVLAEMIQNAYEYSKNHH